MGDLISRSALKKIILDAIEKQNGRSIDLLNVEEVLKVIEKQPTAYDVEKVVKQLEKEFKKHYGNNWDKTPYLVKAIDIVRAGGKE